MEDNSATAAAPAPTPQPQVNENFDQNIFLRAKYFQVTQDWAAQTEPNDWSEQVEWGGSNNW